MTPGSTVSPPSVAERGSNRQAKTRSTTSRHRHTNRVMWAAVALAVIAALAYLLIEVEVLAVGPATGPATIIYVAAGGYLLGGLLILASRRWLWIVGAGINALVILLVSAYQDQPAIFFSVGGLVTKAAQVLLEVCLIHLIVAYPRGSPRGETGGS